MTTAFGNPAPQDRAAGLRCAEHNLPLEMGKVTLSYLGHTFSVDIPRCPVCGQPFIDENLAKDRIREVEHTLEEK